VIPDQFMAGQYPGLHAEEHTRQRMDAFLEAGFTGFIDLTALGELPPYASILHEQAAYYQRRVFHRRFSIGDFGTPSPQHMRTILDSIARALDEDQKVYLHCWAGVGRTGTTVGCWLAEHGLSGEEALRQVNELCFYAHSPETAQQQNFIRNWR
jgi:hypothetical protein